MLKVVATSQFKKDLKKIKNNGKYDIEELFQVVDMLSAEIELPAQYRDHALSGDKKRFRECHIRPDWLLIYEIKKSILVLSLVSTGNHANILGL